MVVLPCIFLPINTPFNSLLFNNNRCCSCVNRCIRVVVLHIHVDCKVWIVLIELRSRQCFGEKVRNVVLPRDVAAVEVALVHAV